MSEFVRQVTPFDENFLHLKLEHTCGLITIVAIYAPPEDHNLEDSEQFYQKLELVVRRCLAGDVFVVLVDFNVEIGSDRLGYELCLDPQNLRARKVNSQILQDLQY